MPFINFNRFILNGLVHANDILGESVFKPEEWKVIGEHVYDNEGGRHQAFYSPIRDFYYKDIHVKAGERVQVEQSLKYSAEAALQLWESSDLREVERWSASSESYSKFREHMFQFVYWSRQSRQQKPHQCEALVPQPRVIIPIA